MGLLPALSMLLSATTVLGSSTMYLDGDLGDDANPGTEKLPLKTLAVAVRRVYCPPSGTRDSCFIFASGSFHSTDVQNIACPPPNIAT